MQAIDPMLLGEQGPLDPCYYMLRNALATINKGQTQDTSCYFCCHVAAIQWFIISTHGLANRKGFFSFSFFYRSCFPLVQAQQKDLKGPGLIQLHHQAEGNWEPQAVGSTMRKRELIFH